MAKYLIHQKRDGTPMGVFSDKEHLYFEHHKSHETYGLAVIDSRGLATPWPEWAEAQASKSPGPTDMWDLYEHEPAPLLTVLMDVKDDTTM